MAFQKKKHKEPYLTDSDRERLAKITDNPFAKLRKFKSLLTLVKKGLEQEVCIYVYGESEEAVKAKADEHLKFFQESDKSWKVKSLVDCKAKDEEEMPEGGNEA